MSRWRKRQVSCSYVSTEARSAASRLRPKPRRLPDTRPKRPERARLGANVIRLAKRALEGAVVLLALYAFATLPLGKRTGLEHLQRILGTPEAEDAGRELKHAGGRLLGEILEFKGGEIRGVPRVPPELLGPAQSLVTGKAPASAAGSEDTAPSTGRTQAGPP